MRMLVLTAVLTGLALACGGSGSGKRTSIVVKDSVVAVGDTFHAEIHVLDTAARFQQFFVVTETDTFRLPVTRNWKVGLLDVLGQHRGMRTINGFSRIEHADTTVVFVEPFQVTFNVE
jgi:hypothetical protein